MTSRDRKSKEERLQQEMRALSTMKADYPKQYQLEVRSNKSTVELGTTSLLFSFNRLVGCSYTSPHDGQQHNFVLGGEHSTQTQKHLNAWRIKDSHEVVGNPKEFEWYVADALQSTGNQQLTILKETTHVQQ